MVLADLVLDEVSLTVSLVRCHPPKSEHVAFLPQLQDEDSLLAGHLWLKTALVERLSQCSNSTSSTTILAKRDKTSTTLE